MRAYTAQDLLLGWAVPSTLLALVFALMWHRLRRERPPEEQCPSCGQTFRLWLWYHCPICGHTKGGLQYGEIGKWGLRWPMPPRPPRREECPQ